MRIIISRSLYNEIQKNLLRVSECLLPVWMRHRFCYSSALYFVKGTYFSFHEDEPGEKTGWYFVSNSYEKNNDEYLYDLYLPVEDVYAALDKMEIDWLRPESE